LRDALPQIRKRGAELVVVGNGRPEYAADFRDSEGLEFPLYTDPDLRSYAAAGLKRSVGSSINLNVIGHGLRAFSTGKRQGATQGDPWQQGGVFVIAPRDRVDFSYVSAEAGDHPDIEDVLAALPRPARRVKAAAKAGTRTRTAKSKRTGR
jgi:peroxiredoxin